VFLKAITGMIMGVVALTIFPVEAIRTITHP